MPKTGGVVESAAELVARTVREDPQYEGVSFDRLAERLKGRLTPRRLIAGVLVAAGGGELRVLRGGLLAPPETPLPPTMEE